MVLGIAELVRTDDRGFIENVHWQIYGAVNVRLHIWDAGWRGARIARL